MNADDSAPFPALIPRWTKPPTVEHSHTARVLAGVVLSVLVDLLLHDPGVRTAMAGIVGAAGALAVSMIEYYRKRLDAAGCKLDLDIRPPRRPRLSQEPGAPSTPPARDDADAERVTPPARHKNTED